MLENIFLPPLEALIQHIFFSSVVVRALGYSSRLMEEDEGPKSSAGIPVSIPGYDSSPIDDLQRAHVDSSDVVEAEDSAARLQAAESAYEKQADFIDDLNDLTHAMMTLLPQRCWLELDACYPSGEFDIPGLAVNKLLNLTSDNLSSLLGTQGGRNLQKGVIFRAGPVGRLARSNGVRAIFIYVDSTGRGPSEGPGFVTLNLAPLELMLSFFLFQALKS